MKQTLEERVSALERWHVRGCTPEEKEAMVRRAEEWERAQTADDSEQPATFVTTD